MPLSFPFISDSLLQNLQVAVKRKIEQRKR
jgi:hypothetical protein